MKKVKQINNKIEETYQHITTIEDEIESLKVAIGDALVRGDDKTSLEVELSTKIDDLAQARKSLEQLKDALPLAEKSDILQSFRDLFATRQQLLAESRQLHQQIQPLQVKRDDVQKRYHAVNRQIDDLKQHSLDFEKVTSDEIASINAEYAS